MAAAGIPCPAASAAAAVALRALCSPAIPSVRRAKSFAAAEEGPGGGASLLL